MNASSDQAGRKAMLDKMSAVKYLLAAASVFLLGTAAGVFVNHAKNNLGYEVPIAMAIGGLAAAAVAWKLHKSARRLPK
jgi:uncharacterized membrane-anchored protein